MFIFISATSAARLRHILQSNPDFNKLQSLMWAFIQLIQSNDPKYKLQIIACHGQNWKQSQLSYLYQIIDMALHFTLYIYAFLSYVIRQDFLGSVGGGTMNTF